MKRSALQQLLKWKAEKARKPLIIRGARQVGKTWLMREFGRTAYKKVAYINLESSPLARSIFEEDLNVERILRGLQIESGVSIDPDTLLILDEIQASPQAITSLKYFYENAPEYPVVSAGSLLGVALTQHHSFPVGKVDFMDLHPLTFPEFLDAAGESALLELLKSRDWSLINTFAPKFVELLRHYYYVGGMPEAVRWYLETQDFDKVRAAQKRLLIAYEQDFSKHAPYQAVPRIRLLWNSIPAQLARENKKFIYGAVRQGGRAKEYEIALAWLKDCGLIRQVHQVSKPAIPLKAYEDFGAFKLFLVDVGLLGAMADLDAHTLLDGQAIFQEFKGALTEQYVLQQLITREDLRIYYWSAENGRAEIDFLVQRAGEVIPIEVKAEENLRAKSLRVYCEKYQPEKAIRSSMSLYREEEWMVNLPLYALSEL